MKPMTLPFVRLLRFVACAGVWAGVCAGASAMPCQGKAAGDAGYWKSAKAIQALPEYRAWSKAHGYPVAFGEFADQKVRIRRTCFWSVTVYADRPERLELWHIFYVTQAGLVRYVENNDGEPTGLGAWRDTMRRRSAGKPTQ